MRMFILLMTVTLCWEAGISAQTPAARQGDMTTHGGVITIGVTTVLIGGLPAARRGDQATCPLSSGATPHVGGPIVTGSTTVLIGGQPAARVGDQASEVGPGSTIATGASAVLIGN